MTNEQIQEARRLCNEVPIEGPWECVNFSDEFGIYQGPVKRSRGEIRYKSSICTLEDPDISDLSTKKLRALGKFIAASRTLLPAALDEIDRLQKLYRLALQQLSKFEDSCWSEALEHKLKRLEAESVVEGSHTQ